MEVAPIQSITETPPAHPPTNYFQTIIHLFKGNIGPGLFAMGYAFKNGGLYVSPVLTVIIAVVAVHCQHLLCICSERMRRMHNANECADYADTVEQCFESGPEKTQSWSRSMKTAVNVFIVVTQLGFCCIYFVFISTNLSQILHAFNIHLNIHLIMLFVFVPILLTSLILNLKWLMPVSLIANVCMVTGLVITVYFAVKDGLPDIDQRKPYTDPHSLALYFGTAIFAFEGIALVLPLKNAMANAKDFDRPLGVLNVGMVLVTLMFMSAGNLGYMKWGDEVVGSLTLNLGDSILAQCVKAMVSLGVLFGYPLQFFIAIQIMWPTWLKWLHFQKKSFTGELIFRTSLVLITLVIAEIVPNLGLFISLIGSLFSTALALVFPPVIELMVKNDENKYPGALVIIKNVIILTVALVGFAAGTWESVSGIIKSYSTLDTEP